MPPSVITLFGALVAHDCSAQLTDADEWIERRELDVSSSPAHPTVIVAKT
jgi:hypothetical protein